MIKETGLIQFIKRNGARSDKTANGELRLRKIIFDKINC
jgi:hypothetical protein